MAEELQEKRCLSIRHCRKEAGAYYGTTIEGLPKALCSSWAESFAFGQETQSLRLGEGFVEHHVKAQDKVNASSQLKRECRQIARDLARCLQTAKITRK